MKSRGKDIGYINAAKNGSIQPVVLQSRGGNVGIGITNPSHALTVNGAVRANQFISNKKTYADYVLKPDYALAPLSDVEAHIKEKGHLPGIPSEAEAFKDGCRLAMRFVIFQSEMVCVPMPVLSSGIRIYP